MTLIEEMRSQSSSLQLKEKMTKLVLQLLNRAASSMLVVSVCVGWGVGGMR